MNVINWLDACSAEEIVQWLRENERSEENSDAVDYAQVKLMDYLMDHAKQMTEKWFEAFHHIDSHTMESKFNISANLNKTSGVAFGYYQSYMFIHNPFLSTKYDDVRDLHKLTVTAYTSPTDYEIYVKADVKRNNKVHVTYDYIDGEWTARSVIS